MSAATLAKFAVVQQFTFKSVSYGVTRRRSPWRGTPGSVELFNYVENFNPQGDRTSPNFLPAILKNDSFRVYHAGLTIIFLTDNLRGQE
jgi:hypothetical protein